MAAREAAPSDAAGKLARAAEEATAGVAAAAAATTAATALKSPLDKLLSELTEEDIAQVTREECRRFLKEKGMRRPSWNKSQSIQQVISLKALLEGRHDAEDDASAAAPSIPAFIAKRPPDAPLPVAAPQVTVSPPLGSPLPRGEPAGAEPRIEAPGSLPSPYRRRDPPVAAFPSADAYCRFPAAGGGAPSPSTASLSPRCASTRLAHSTFLRLTAAEGEAPAGQLTIFYDGRVNVYDEVTTEKARVIMQIAASPSYYDLPPVPTWSSLPSRPLQCHDQTQPLPPQATGGGGCFRPPLAPVSAVVATSPPPVLSPKNPQNSGRFPPHFRESVEELRIPREVDAEGPTSRAASLQRYLEKRKDRFKCKKNVVGSSSSMEMYLSQRTRDQLPNGQIGCSSPTQAPRPPQTPTRCNSMENPVQNLRISIDLNDEDMQEG